jgi:hypothetical protein
VTGPGHGGPGLAANTWLEGTYPEIYPRSSQDATGMERLGRGRGPYALPGLQSSAASPLGPRCRGLFLRVLGIHSIEHIYAWTLAIAVRRVVRRRRKSAAEASRITALMV